MKRTRCERSTAAPASTDYTVNPPPAEQALAEPGADGTRPTNQEAPAVPVTVLPDAPPMPPMPFPGPFAYLPLPAAVNAQRGEGAQSSTAAPAPPPANSPDSAISGPGLTAALRVPDFVAKLLQLAALHMAAQAGDHPTVQAVLDVGGVDVDALDGHQGSSALMLAAQNGHAGIVAALLNAGASVNLAQSGSGMTALICAAEKGHVAVVHALLSHQDIRPDHRAQDGGTALMHAAVNNHPQVIDCLRAAGAQPNHCSSRTGFTALIRAASCGYLDVVRALLQFPGIALDQPAANGVTALTVAAFQNRPEIVSCLLAAGAQVNLADSRTGATALIYAAQEGHVPVLRVLLEHPDIDLEQWDADFDTALMAASAQNNAQAAACLLAAGASMNHFNLDGDTIMSVAIKRTHAAVLEVFLGHGERLDSGDMDFFPAVPTASIIAIADLCDERNMPAPELLPPEQAHAFFSGLNSALHGQGPAPRMMRWLRGKGIRMACAQQLAAALGGAHAAWRQHRAGPGPATAQQQMMYTLCALGSLGARDGAGKVLALYQAAGISAAAAERLAAAANRQLDHLISLALETAAEVGSGMLNALADGCLAMTGLNYRVDPAAMQARLVQDGYCAPLAEVIALAWREAIAALHEMRPTLPEQLNLGQLAQFVHDHGALHAPVLFAQALRRLLDSRERLSALQATLGPDNDHGLHALFQIQCDQLRQYCAQLIGSRAERGSPRSD